MKNTVVWFEIPVTDLERAAEFYSAVFAIKLQPFEMGPNKYAFLPFEPGEASGALVKSTNAEPSDKGCLLYLNGGDDLADPLSRVEGARGGNPPGKNQYRRSRL